MPWCKHLHFHLLFVRLRHLLAGNAELRRAMGQAGRRRYEQRFRSDIAARALLEGVLTRR